jgi:hypothetical protein
MKFLLLNIIFYIILLFPLNIKADIQPNFNVIFAADPSVASDTGWLTTIAENWGATGICIRLTWISVDNDSIPGTDSWQHLDKAIRTITNVKYAGKNLDIYIRVCMGLGKPNWIKSGSFGFVDDDFQVTNDGKKYDHRIYENNCPDCARYPLNFCSLRSISRMKEFLNKVLNHINSYPYEKRKRIKEIVPTFNSTDEQEYPNSIMCGYSYFEIKAFRNYLRDKYNDISDLNNLWNTNYKSFNKINPKDYNWWNITPYTIYTNPKGRIEWMNFRTLLLTSFINSLANMCDRKGYKMGAQIGSLYDYGIEFRGWTDPTKLFEKINDIHTADIYQYSTNFDFAANYSRSLVKFWMSIRNDLIYFSTETDWPGFNDQSPEFLSEKWREQLDAYYKMGANAIYLIGWDVPLEKLNQFAQDYNEWKNTLITYSKLPIIKQIIVTDAVHLACEKVLYNNHNEVSANNRFALVDSIAIKSTLNKGRNSVENDIITNYMIEKKPAYIRKYKKIYMNKTSRYISDKANSILKNSKVNIVE